MKIDISEWGFFRVGDLFYRPDLKILKPDFNKVFDTSLERNEEFSLPLINAKHGNNGIMFYGRKQDFEFADMCLGIVQNGASATGDVYAQIQPTGILWDAYLIKPFKTVDKYILLFLSCVIERMIKQRFSYDDKAIWEKVQNESILLPLNADEEPNWSYMSSYMKDLEEGACKSVAALHVQYQPVRINIEAWKRFQINDLFEVVKGTRLTKADMRDGEINYVGASAINNGITKRIANNESIHPGGVLTVCYNGSVGETFYQDSPFWASDDVNVLYPRFSMDKWIALFIAPLIKQVGKAKYEFIDKWKREDMKRDTILLPITPSGEPDWIFMSDYMKSLEITARANISSLSHVSKEAYNGQSKKRVRCCLH